MPPLQTKFSRREVRIKSRTLEIAVKGRPRIRGTGRQRRQSGDAGGEDKCGGMELAQRTQAPYGPAGQAAEERHARAAN